MKTLSIICVILLLCQLSIASNNMTQLRLFTMNIHCFEDHWQFRLEKILDYVVANQIELVSLQEVCTEPQTSLSQIDFIYKYLISKGYPIAAFESQFTHPSWNRYDEFILSFSSITPTNIEKGQLPKSLMQRGFISIQINGFWATNVHLEYRHDNAYARKNQIEFLQSRYRGQSKIVMGDFNSSPESPEQKPFWNEDDYSVFPGPTFIGTDDNGQNRIDGFWISRSLVNSFRQISGQVVLDQKIGDQYLSDHFGVLLNLNF